MATAYKALPARPHLNYLKKLAKEHLAVLRAQHPQAKLAAAQLAVAREHGFASWRALKVHVDQIRARIGPDMRVAQFLEAALSPINDLHRAGDLAQAEEILKTDPRLDIGDIYIASATANLSRVRELLRENP